MPSTYSNHEPLPTNARVAPVQRTLSASRALLGHCRRIGLDTARIIENAELPPALNHDPDLPLTLDGRAALWRAACKAARDPHLHLRVAEEAPFGAYRKCENYREHGVCNWLVPAAETPRLCQACRLNHVIPDLSDPDNHKLWGAIEQAKRTDIQYVVAGAGSKEMIKKVMDGDKMIPVDVLYPPAMVGTALEMTVANFYGQVPVRGVYTIDATLVTKDNAKDFYFPDSPF